MLCPAKCPSGYIVIGPLPLKANRPAYIFLLHYISLHHVCTQVYPRCSPFSLLYVLSNSRSMVAHYLPHVLNNASSIAAHYPLRVPSSSSSVAAHSLSCILIQVCLLSQVAVRKEYNLLKVADSSTFSLHTLRILKGRATTVTCITAATRSLALTRNELRQYRHNTVITADITQ